MKRAALVLLVVSALSAGCGDNSAATTTSASAAPALGLSPEQAARVVAKVGDTVYDGSLRTQLRTIRDELSK